MAKVSEMNRNNKVISSLMLMSSLFLVACGGSSSNNGSATRLTEEDFNNQVYVLKGGLRFADSYTFFNKDKTGTEFIGNIKDKPFSKNRMTWSINDNKSLDVAFDGGKGGYSFSRESIEKNIFIGRRKSSRDVLELYKALPLKPADLNTKVVQFIAPGGCSEKNDVRTLKVVGSKATLKDICAGKKAYPVVFDIQKSNMPNTVEFKQVGGGKHILMSLIEGNVEGVDSEAEVSMVYLNEKNVTTEKIKIVDKEAPSK